VFMSPKVWGWSKLTRLSPSFPSSGRPAKEKEPVSEINYSMSGVQSSFVPFMLTVAPWGTFPGQLL